MQPHESDDEDSGGLLSELNMATIDVMEIDVILFGGAEWQKAHQRQQEAFANWLRYIRQDPVFKRRLPPLAG